MQIMKKFPSWMIASSRLLLLMFLGLLLVAGPVIASSGGSFDLSWWTADGGSGTSTGNNYALSGTIGQIDAGGPLNGGAFILGGGFWAGVKAGDWSVYLPIIIR